jgi:hypothetical protein
MYETKTLADRIVQMACTSRKVLSMPIGCVFAKLENCFHSGAGGFCCVAIFYFFYFPYFAFD